MERKEMIQTFDVRDMLFMRYPKKDVSKGLLTEAFEYFRYFFEIDEMTGIYRCGTLKKLSKIIGRDYLTSDLLIDVADDFDEEYIPVLDDDIELAWLRSFVYIIGEENWKKALDGNVSRRIKDKIIEMIYRCNECFDFNSGFDGSNEVLKLVTENINVFKSIYFFVVEYCEEKNLDIEFALSSVDTNKEYMYDIFSIIDKICYRWYKLSELTEF